MEKESDKKTIYAASKNWQSTFAVKHLSEVVAKAKLTIGINKKTALYITSRPSDLECVRLHAAKIQRFFDFATFSSKKSENRGDLTVTVNRERVNSIPIEEAKGLSPY